MANNRLIKTLDRSFQQELQASMDQYCPAWDKQPLSANLRISMSTLCPWAVTPDHLTLAHDLSLYASIAAAAQPECPGQRSMLSAGSCTLLLLVLHWQPAGILPSALLLGDDLQLPIYALQKVDDLLKLCRHGPQDFICTSAGHTCHMRAQPVCCGV